MYFALLVSKIPQVRESHPHYADQLASMQQQSAKPPRRWWTAIRTLLKRAV